VKLQKKNQIALEKNVLALENTKLPYKPKNPGKAIEAWRHRVLAIILPSLELVGWLICHGPDILVLVGA
jgi:hypothetical protein